MFTHIILTRFNVKSDGWSTRGLDPQWLSHRFKLFETYCLPSIQSQTCKDFQWIVFFDKDTPKEFIDRIEQIKDKWWTPIYVSVLTGDLVLQTIHDHLVEGTKYLITTKLDNDDGVAKDFVQRIQASFREEREYLNFPVGFVLNQGRLYRNRDLHTPFVSLVERCDSPFDAVWKVEHTLIATHAPVRQLEGKPAWLQVVHGNNVQNRVRGARCGPESLAGDFVLDPGTLVQTESLYEKLVDRCIRYPLTSGRDWVAEVTRKPRRQFKRLVGRFLR